MLEIGIGETSEPLRCLKANACPPELALGILRYASEFPLWKPGKVRRRLCCLLPGQSPDDRSKWMLPDFGQTHPAQQSKATAQAQTQLANLRQLEFEFGNELKDLSTAQILERYEIPETVAASLRKFPTWRHTDRTPWLRAAVLEVLKTRQSKG
jgi:hypothetical protein